MTVNRRVDTSLCDHANAAITSVRPAGRQTGTTLDALGRPASVQVGTLTPMAFTYDAAGRLSTRTQGTRTTTMAYDGAGYLQSVTDPLSRTVSFTNDTKGRPTWLLGSSRAARRGPLTEPGNPSAFHAIGRALSQQFHDDRTARRSRLATTPPAA